MSRVSPKSNSVTEFMCQVPNDLHHTNRLLLCTFVTIKPRPANQSVVSVPLFTVSATAA
ncbi:UNVERIFIED_CONTAM: hypothetical protein FKN15_053298 [Acipenser sinensis]